MCGCRPLIKWLFKGALSPGGVLPQVQEYHGTSHPWGDMAGSNAPVSTYLQIQPTHSDSSAGYAPSGTYPLTLHGLTMQSILRGHRCGTSPMVSTVSNLGEVCFSQRVYSVIVTDHEYTIKDSLPQSCTGNVLQEEDYDTSLGGTIGLNGSGASDPRAQQICEVSNIGYATTRSLDLWNFPAAKITQGHGRGTMLGAPSDVIPTSLNLSGVGLS